MKGYLLDTNHLSAAVRRVSPIRDRIRETHRKGIPFGTCWPVLCELEFGIAQTADPEGYRRTLTGLPRRNPRLALRLADRAALWKYRQRTQGARPRSVTRGHSLGHLRNTDGFDNPHDRPRF